MEILVYGSLRQGEYNFDRISEAFGENSIKKVGEAEVEGFKMHNLGSYPAIVKGDKSDKILCDILEVGDDASRFIDYMETGAGYAKQMIDSRPIYVMNKNVSHTPIVASGNWKKRKENA